ncbi:hypothetical protein FISHEDRAFT_77702 [Fistulina hepatica ATCC 64428]|nr:hypothetical protein FISHEDRAFT_77702 [Fistulina hepatica ATCC 64428]
MYPYPWFHSYHHWHRGPSRLLWFIIGAVSAAYWMKRKQWCDDSTYRRCFRPRVPPPYIHQHPWPESAIPTSTPEGPSQSVPGCVPVGHVHPRPALPTQSSVGDNRGSPFPSPWSFPPPPWGFSPQDQERRWQEERERMAAMARQAGDAMAEMSEATLDQVLATVESLKAKLAEHRAQREAQKKALEKELEEHERNPPRFV